MTKHTRVLVLAPHPADEFGIAMTLRAHVRRGDDVHVLWCAPDDRPRIAKMRRDEALQAMEKVGVPVEQLRFIDLEPLALPEQLPQLARALRDEVERVRPDLVYVPAFEGGHPDHDALNFVVWEAVIPMGVAALEFPLYTAAKRRFLSRVPSFSRLLSGPGQPTERRLIRKEIEFKRRLWEMYRTQRNYFDWMLRVSGDRDRYFGIEQVRPLPLRDYMKPPGDRPLLYERAPVEKPYTFEEFAEKIRRYQWSGGIEDQEI